MDAQKPSSKSSNKLLTAVLSIEITASIILAIFITINATTPTSSSNTQQSNATQPTTEKDMTDQNNPTTPDTRPTCAANITTNTPFSDVYMDYPYAGVYESTGKYLCNTDFNYGVIIPQNITKVYYYDVNGGDIHIVGLEKDGQILSTPFSSSTLSLAGAGILTAATEKNLQEIKQSSSHYDSYKTVLTDVNYSLLENASDDDYMKQLFIAMYGEENPKFLILFTEAINPQTLMEDPVLQGPIPADLANQLQSEYNNRNTELVEIVNKIFGNPENYVHLTTNNQ